MKQVTPDGDFSPATNKLQTVTRGERVQISNGNSKQRLHNQMFQQQRRRWGDWSECSKDCLKTRHRRNCDDLIQVQSSTTGPIKSGKSNLISVTESGAAGGGGGNKTSQKRHTVSDGVSGGGGKVGEIGSNEGEEVEEDLLLKTDQGSNNEDEDYADVGDGDEDEDETDSCEKVDASKTTEQIPCVGGLCRLTTSNQLTGSGAEQGVNIFPRTNNLPVNSKSRDRKVAQGRQRTSVEQQGNPLLVSDENEYPTTGRQRSRNNPTFRLTPPDIWQHMNGARQANSTTANRLSHNNNLTGGQTFQINSRNGPENLSTFGGQTIINSNGTFGGEELAILDNSIATTNPNNGATTTTTSLSSTTPTTPADSITNSVWMKSMWPNHLINGMVSAATTTTTNQPNLNQPATLIQWTILIGSLLSVVLLILLILRKLFISTFPSYQWMLAKQTLKNTSKLNQTAVANLDCCQASAAAAAAAAIHKQNRHFSLSGSTVQANSNHAMLTPCVAIASAASSTSSPASLFAGGFKSSNKHHHHIHYQQASPIPPHHMCYAWRRQQQQPTQVDIQGEGVIDGNKHRLAANGNSNNAITAHQYIVDANGKHILSSSLGADFNTDIYDLPASFAHESANSMTNSTTTSGYKVALTTMSNNHNNIESQSVTSVANYNYDTLNSNYGNQALNVVQQDNSRQFQQQHITHNYLPQTSFNGQQQAQHNNNSKHTAGRTFNNFNQDNSRLDSSISGLTNSLNQHQTTSSLIVNETTKHRSPKVPKSQKRFDQATKPGRELSVDDTKSNSSGGSSSSLTISGNSEGSGESNSSPSIQSTTAQMLSNAASCSFEQTPDQNNDFQLTPLSCADGNYINGNSNSNNNNSNDASMSSIPASNGSSLIVSNLNNVNHRAKNVLSSAKLVCSNTAQSQPNSPIILANQLSNRTSHGKPIQRTGHSNASKLSTGRLKLWNQNNSSEPDCSQLDGSSDQRVVQQQQHESELQEQFPEQKSDTSSHGLSNAMGCNDKDQSIIKDSTLLQGEANDNNSIRDQQCDMDEDRHYYEEITSHNQAI